MPVTFLTVTSTRLAQSHRWLRHLHALIFFRSIMAPELTPAASKMNAEEKDGSRRLTDALVLALRRSCARSLGATLLSNARLRLLFTQECPRNTASTIVDMLPTDVSPSHSSSLTWSQATMSMLLMPRALLSTLG